MNDIQIINLTPENIVDYGVCGYKDVQKHTELVIFSNTPIIK